MTVTAVGAQPACVTGSDGKITASVSGGKSPFSYSLSGPATAGPQASPIFTGLVPGSYIVSVTDACGEIRTHAVSVPVPIDFTFNNVTVASDDFVGPLSIIPSTIPGDCNRVRGKVLNYIAQSIPGGVIINRTIKVFDHVPNTLIYTNTITGNLDNNYVLFLKNKQYRIEVYDNCNTTFIKLVNFISKSADVSHVYNNCGTSANAEIISKVVNTDQYYAASQNMPETFTITAGPSGVGTSVTGNTNIANFNNLLPGNYTFRITDACETIFKNYTIPPLPAFNVYAFQAGESSCLDSTAAINFSSDLSGNETISYYRLMSGPASFTDVYGVVRNISYPITLITNSSVAKQGNYPKGNYTVSALTNCGRTATATFTIGNPDLTVRKYSIAAVSLCTNSGNIIYTKSGQHWEGENPVLNAMPSGPPLTPSVVTGNETKWNNIAAGSYRLRIMTNAVTYSLVSGNCPRVVVDTIINLGYVIPSATAISSLACDNGSSAQITVNNVTGGASPFTYSIISGPVTRPPQASNVFSNLPEGTYTVRTVDACGNGVVTSTSTTRLDPVFVFSGSSCADSTVYMAVTNYQGAAYNWTGPNSFTATGSSVTISNFNPATQTGTYTVGISYSNCPDIFRTYVLNICAGGPPPPPPPPPPPAPIMTVTLDASIIGCTRQANWTTANEQNVQQYTLQYSTDGISFTDLINVPPATSGSTPMQQYNFILPPLPTGLLYFRVRITQLNYSTSFSNIDNELNTCIGNIVTVTPNPVSDYIFLNGLTIGGRIFVYNSVGQLMSKHNITAVNHKILSAHFAKGVYFVRIVGENYFKTIRIIK